MVTKVGPTIKAPIVLFTYFNPIIRRGMDKFCAQIKAAGASGKGEGGKGGEGFSEGEEGGRR
jgi:hypothetical protein